MRLGRTHTYPHTQTTVACRVVTFSATCQGNTGWETLPGSLAACPLSRAESLLEFIMSSKTGSRRELVEPLGAGEEGMVSSSMPRPRRRWWRSRAGSETVAYRSATGFNGELPLEEDITSDSTKRSGLEMSCCRPDSVDSRSQSPSGEYVYLRALCFVFLSSPSSDPLLCEPTMGNSKLLPPK